MKNFYLLFFLLNLIAFSTFFLLNEYQILLNFEAGSIAGLITIIGSFKGYENHIKKRVSDLSHSNYTDELEQYEDPYQIYEEESQDIQNPKEFLQKIKKEQRFTKNWGEILKTSKGFFSVFRIVGYLLIIFSFFFLVGKDIFSPIGFILGISVVPISVLATMKKLF